MSRPGGRERRWAAVAGGLVAAVALLLSASPGTAAATSPVTRATLESDTVWTVDRGHERLVVAADITASLPGEAAGEIGSFAITLPAEATAVFATDPAGAGRPATLTWIRGSDPAGAVLDPTLPSATQRLTVALDPPLRPGEEIRTHITFNLQGGAARSSSRVRVGRAFVEFRALGFGDRGSVRIVFPSGYAPHATDPAMTERPAINQFVLERRGIAGAGDWSARITATDESAFKRTSFNVTIAGERREVVVRSWPEDPPWQARVKVLLARVLPRFDALLRWGWAGRGVLEVEEVGAGSLGGYAGIFEPGQNRIRIGETMDALTIAHEASHAWIDNALFDERWMVEGAADALAEAVLSSEMRIEHDGPENLDPDDPVAFPLPAWGEFDEATAGAALSRDAWAYDASWTVMRTIVDEIGIERFAGVLRAAADRADPYDLDAAPGRPRPAGWRYLLDLLEEAGGSTRAEAIFRGWVLRGDRAALAELDQRAAARTELAHLRAAAPDLALPPAVAAPLTGWQLDRARREIATALRLVSLRAANDERRAELTMASWTSFAGRYAAASNLGELMGHEEAEALALTVLIKVRAAAVAPRDVLMSVGLAFEAPPERRIADAIRAAAGDRWPEAQQEILAVARTLAQAPMTGALVLGGGAAGIAGAGVLGLLAVLRRSRGRRKP